jgi:hypothetical protein
MFITDDFISVDDETDILGVISIDSCLGFLVVRCSRSQRLMAEELIERFMEISFIVMLFVIRS